MWEVRMTDQQVSEKGLKSSKIAGRVKDDCFYRIYGTVNLYKE